MSTLALLLKGQLHKSDLLGAELINHSVRVSFGVGGVNIIYTNRTIAVKFLSPDVPGWSCFSGGMDCGFSHPPIKVWKHRTGC